MIEIGYKLPVIERTKSGKVMYSIVTVVDNTVYVKVAERVDLNCPHYSSKNENDVR